MKIVIFIVFVTLINLSNGVLDWPKQKYLNLEKSFGKKGKETEAKQLINLSNEVLDWSKQKYLNLEKIFGKKGKENEAKPPLGEHRNIQLDGIVQRIAGWAGTLAKPPTQPNLQRSQRFDRCLLAAEEKKNAFVSGISREEYVKLVAETKQLVDDGCLEATTEHADDVGSYAAAKYKVKDNAGNEVGSVILPTQPSTPKLERTTRLSRCSLDTEKIKNAFVSGMPQAEYNKLVAETKQLVDDGCLEATNEHVDDVGSHAATKYKVKDNAGKEVESVILPSQPSTPKLERSTRLSRCSLDTEKIKNAFVSGMPQDKYDELVAETKRLVDDGCLEATTEHVDDVGSHAATKYKIKDNAGKEVGSVILPTQPSTPKLERTQRLNRCSLDTEKIKNAFVSGMPQDKYDELVAETKRLVDDGCLEATTEHVDDVGSHAATKYKIKDNAGKEVGSVILPTQPSTPKLERTQRLNRCSLDTEKIKNAFVSGMPQDKYDELVAETKRLVDDGCLEATTEHVDDVGSHAATKYKVKDNAGKEVESVILPTTQGGAGATGQSQENTTGAQANPPTQSKLQRSENINRCLVTAEKIKNAFISGMSQEEYDRLVSETKDLIDKNCLEPTTDPAANVGSYAATEYEVKDASGQKTGTKVTLPAQVGGGATGQTQGNAAGTAGTQPQPAPASP